MILNNWRIVGRLIFILLDLLGRLSGDRWRADCRGGLAFLFLFLFFLSASSLAVLATSTLVAALVADCFVVIAHVLQLGFEAPLAAGRLATSPPAS
jgi:hypothetical protein